jgi:hypothetical protein
MKISKNYGLRLATAGYYNTAGTYTASTPAQLRKAIRYILKRKVVDQMKALKD